MSVITVDIRMGHGLGQARRNPKLAARAPSPKFLRSALYRPLPGSYTLIRAILGLSIQIWRQRTGGRSPDAGGMNLEAIIESWCPPDEDFQDLLEDAFLSYQIDSVTYRLACIWLDSNIVSEQ